MRLIELMVRIVPTLRGCLRVGDRHKEQSKEEGEGKGERQKVILCYCCLVFMASINS